MPVRSTTGRRPRCKSCIASIAVVIFMGLVTVPTLQEYWSEDGFLGRLFVKRIMSHSRFMPLLWNLHLSDPDEDLENQRLKTNNDPKYHQIACQSFYVPNINISIDERMVASKARVGIKQYIKDKPTRWGFKLFVICDSKTGYYLILSYMLAKANVALTMD